MPHIGVRCYHVVGRVKEGGDLGSRALQISFPEVEVLENWAPSWDPILLTRDTTCADPFVLESSAGLCETDNHVANTTMILVS